MLIKLINFGGRKPERAHYNDAGADVFAHLPNTGKMYEVVEPGTIKKIPLGFGIEVPDGYVAFVLPRSGMTTKFGLTAEVVPIDSGYRGEIHAIVANNSKNKIIIEDGNKIAQLVIVPTVIATFTYKEQEEREKEGFGSTDTEDPYETFGVL